METCKKFTSVHFSVNNKISEGCSLDINTSKGIENMMIFSADGESCTLIYLDNINNIIELSDNKFVLYCRDKIDYVIQMKNSEDESQILNALKPRVRITAKETLGPPTSTYKASPVNSPPIIKRKTNIVDELRKKISKLQPENDVFDDFQVSKPLRREKPIERVQIPSKKQENQKIFTFNKRVEAKDDEDKENINVQRKELKFREPLKPVNQGNGLSPVKSGFINLGNTCYVNSILQAFIRRPSFERFIEENQTTCSIISTIQSIIKEITKTKNTKELKDRSISPINLMNLLLEMGFPVYEQQDAHEFFTFLIDKVANSTFHSLFTIKINQNFECKSCRRLTQKEESVNELSLALSNGIQTHEDSVYPFPQKVVIKSISDTSLKLNSLLINYFQRDDVSLNCENCSNNEFVCYKKISEFPKYLIIHLQRFTFLNSLPKKLTDLQIQFQPFLFLCNGNGETVKYKLVSVISHLGKDLNSGHYVTDVLMGDNSWHTFDDIYEIDLGTFYQMERKRSKSAYILVYEMQ